MFNLSLMVAILDFTNNAMSKVSTTIVYLISTLTGNFSSIVTLCVFLVVIGPNILLMAAILNFVNKKNT